MSTKQKDKAMNQLSAGLKTAAAEIYTQQSMLESSNKGITEEYGKGIRKPLNNGITNIEEAKRGPKKKGEFKKVTLNLEVDLNLKLDEYILSLKQKSLRSGADAPSKSEWVRDVVEEKLRSLGVVE